MSIPLSQRLAMARAANNTAGGGGGGDSRPSNPNGIPTAVTAGRYQLGDLLGKGVIGRVFRGLNLRTGEVVAVKQMDKKQISEQSLEDITRELQLLETLDHPNTVKFLESFELEGYLYFILEYVEGGSLHDALKKFGVFPPRLVVVFMAQVLRGLQYLHQQGIMHRDIKGANILLTKEGICKLADFGSCAYTSLNRNASLAGTPFWMAPEFIEGTETGPQSDIWSVGCTVIELITGVPPYWESGPQVALYKMVQNPKPPYPPGLSEDLTDFLDHCFIRDIKQRPNAEQLQIHPWIAALWGGAARVVSPAPSRKPSASPQKERPHSLSFSLFKKEKKDKPSRDNRLSRDDLPKKTKSGEIVEKKEEEKDKDKEKEKEVDKEKEKEKEKESTDKEEINAGELRESKLSWWKMKEAEAEKRKQKEEKRKQRTGKANKAEENKKAIESHYQMLLIANAKDHSPNITPGSSPEMSRPPTMPEENNASTSSDESKPKLSAELSSLGFSQKSIKYSNDKPEEEQKEAGKNEEQKEERKEDNKSVQVSDVTRSIEESQKEIEKLSKEKQTMVQRLQAAKDELYIQKESLITEVRSWLAQLQKDQPKLDHSCWLPGMRCLGYWRDGTWKDAVVMQVSFDGKTGAPSYRVVFIRTGREQTLSSEQIRFANHSSSGLPTLKISITNGNAVSSSSGDDKVEDWTIPDPPTPMTSSGSTSEGDVPEEEFKAFRHTTSSPDIKKTGKKPHGHVKRTNSAK